MSKPRNGRRLLLATGVAAALLVPTALMEAGAGAAAPDSAAAGQYAPSNTTAPAVSGTPTEGQTLTGATGSWASTTAVTYTYQWQRCNAQGGACADISGSTGSTYTAQTADVGSTLRVRVTARNQDGSTAATSAQTAVVASAGPAGATKEPNGRTSVPAASLSLPDRLTVDQVQFSPSIVRSLTTMTARFHVTNTKGYDVRDVLVYALGLPYSRVTQAAEVATGTDGWATIQFQPERLFPRKGYVTFFVRARKSGDDPLAGISTRRLVQVTINR
jgi:hypothetical protein